MKYIAILSLCVLLLTACSEPPLDPVESDGDTDNAPPLTQIEATACSKLNISIKNAEWAKAQSEQAPHQLIITATDETHMIHNLGIDRSPDFYFKIEAADFYDLVLIKGAARFLAYDCQNSLLQELDVSMEPDTELVDAQSGLIIDVKTSEDGFLFLDVQDYKIVRYKLNANREFIRL